MEFFERQWFTYRTIVNHNLMEHGPLAEATAAALEGWLAQRPPGAAPPRMLDLGCGDLALLAPLLQRLPLGSYTGLDLSAAVLPRAQAALGPVPYPCNWQQADLQSWIQAEGPAIDILHSAFAIHHLSEAEKETFLRAARGRISPQGIFLWADVFREPGETLAPYLERYTRRMRGWQVLSPEQQAQAIDHVSCFDQPAERGAIEATATAAGWQWQWIWQGSHNSEALALLTPL
ncbi:MAG: class I SAM-dependent methyltransferase [Prochlorococcaceae cyanobacterium]